MDTRKRDRKRSNRVTKAVQLLAQMDDAQERREYSMELARIAQQYEREGDVAMFVYDARDANHEYMRLNKAYDALGGSSR